MAATLTALVTGGSRGIGRSVVEALTRDGVTVLDPSRGELDLASTASVDEYLAGLESNVDILVVNAGQNNPAPLESLDDLNWSQTMRVNVESSLQLIRGLAPGMGERGYGRVVAISSAYATRARAGRAAYSASKAALEAVVRTTAIEYAHRGILANCVAPGFVMTDLTRQNNSAQQIAALADKVPMGRLAEPEEIADLVAYLASAGNTYITGQTINVDGGLSCL